MSTGSKANLATTDHSLGLVCCKALDYGVVDFGVVCGHRSEELQNAAYRLGNSSVKWPDSKHNSLPSKAVDLMIYHEQVGYLSGDPAQLKDLSEQFKCTLHAVKEWIIGKYYQLATLMKLAAEAVGKKLRWGGDWDGDGLGIDQTFNDLFHFELVD